MPFGPPYNPYMLNSETLYEEDEQPEETETPLQAFLREYRDLVERYDLIFVKGELWDVAYLLNQSQGWNDRRNYKGYVYPETREKLLEEILDISLKNE